MYKIDSIRVNLGSRSLLETDFCSLSKARFRYRPIKVVIISERDVGKVNRSSKMRVVGSR